MNSIVHRMIPNNFTQQVDYEADDESDDEPNYMSQSTSSSSSEFDDDNADMEDRPKPCRVHGKNAIPKKVSPRNFLTPHNASL